MAQVGTPPDSVPDTGMMVHGRADKLPGGDSDSSDDTTVDEVEPKQPATLPVLSLPDTPTQRQCGRVKPKPKRRFLRAPPAVEAAAAPGEPVSSVPQTFTDLQYGEKLSDDELTALLTRLGKDTSGDHAEKATRLITVVRQDQANRRQQARENYQIQAAKFKEELAAAQLREKSKPEGAMAQQIAEQLRKESEAANKANSSTYSWSSQISGAVLPDDIEAPIENPDFVQVGKALDSIAVPVNTSRGNVKVRLVSAAASWSLFLQGQQPQLARG